MDVLPFDQYVASLNRKRSSAAAVFYDGEGRVLLVEPSYKPHLELPGGAVEADEPPWRTVAREVREELGLVREFGTPVVVDYLPTNDRFPEGLAWLFDGGPITASEVAALSLCDQEIVSADLYPVDVLRERTPPTLAARIAVAQEMVGLGGGLALCENGKRVG